MTGNDLAEVQHASLNLCIGAFHSWVGVYSWYKSWGPAPISRWGQHSSRLSDFSLSSGWRLLHECCSLRPSLASWSSKHVSAHSYAAFSHKWDNSRHRKLEWRWDTQGKRPEERAPSSTSCWSLLSANTHIIMSVYLYYIFTCDKAYQKLGLISSTPQLKTLNPEQTKYNSGFPVKLFSLSIHETCIKERL